ncbi:hypothetical protein EXN66_Car014461 [Channa argus]|uniref:Uncharacterized protein n=1 Tax=Channa argus TaxID=215402 RepID=A0A6G1Q8N2_CHAAH|nr:hypothetical protein EXN66_Car014461 [Channa argus]
MGFALQIKNKVIKRVNFYYNPSIISQTLRFICDPLEGLNPYDGNHRSELHLLHLNKLQE